MIAASVAGVSLIVAHRFQLSKKMALAVGRRLTRLPDDEAWRALAAGDLEGAELRAGEMLAAAAGAQSEVNWLPDDQRHRAHIILGYVHLRRGDLDAAEAELISHQKSKQHRCWGHSGPTWGWPGNSCSQVEPTASLSLPSALVGSGEGPRGTRTYEAEVPMAAAIKSSGGRTACPPAPLARHDDRPGSARRAGEVTLERQHRSQRAGRP